MATYGNMTSQNEPFDVLIVGGGHAGCEAVLATARMGLRSALITQSLTTIAQMPCNPAVGGIAKSHLVCELDALGGEMPANADYTGIQFRVLNTKKGPAVRANRVQSDKACYARRMLYVLNAAANVSLIEGTVAELQTHSDRICGLSLANGQIITASAVILTPGTFLNGRLHVGSRQWPGGRLRESSSLALSSHLHRLGFGMAKLKTGTPPRLDPKTLDYAAMIEQPGTEPAPFFSWQAHKDRPLFHVEQSPSPLRPWTPGSNQVSCYLTRTTDETHDIVASNLKKSSLYGGGISGTGVRYCPSIEDKIVKFSTQTSHHVFIEPEGRGAALIYPNGLSNSMPEDIQKKMVQSVPGLQKAEIMQYGYAIEYDFCDPTQLRHTLETKKIENLYFAGQINGTTGYEEAAAQGFMAGVNAGRKLLGKTPVVLGRDDGYIGVLLDDLVLKGTDEPYRMFTSRAEYRLLLRQDNARFRLLSVACELGLADPEYLSESAVWQRMTEQEWQRLKVQRHGSKTLAEILSRPDVQYQDLPEPRANLPAKVIEQVELAVKYHGYIQREMLKINKHKSLEDKAIPNSFAYAHAHALSYEAREKLSRLRPATLGQASRVPGVSPADIAALSVLIARC